MFQFVNSSLRKFENCSRWEIRMRGVAERCLIVTVVLLASTAVFAHHGTNASYDATKAVTLTGVVTRFTFRNPHSFVEFDVKNEQGEMVPVSYTHLRAHE